MQHLAKQCTHCALNENNKVTLNGHIQLIYTRKRGVIYHLFSSVSLMQSKSNTVTYRLNLFIYTIQYNKQFILCRISDKIVTQRRITSLNHLTLMHAIDKMFLYSLFTCILKGTFKHLLHDFIKKKYVYAFYLR